MSDYYWLLMLLVLSERQRKKQNGESPRHEAGVETDLEIAKSNCGASHIGALGTVSKGIEK